jgi:hypothetical protein
MPLPGRSRWGGAGGLPPRPARRTGGTARRQLRQARRPWRSASRGSQHLSRWSWRPPSLARKQIFLPWPAEGERLRVPRTLPWTFTSSMLARHRSLCVAITTGMRCRRRRRGPRHAKNAAAPLPLVGPATRADAAMMDGRVTRPLRVGCPGIAGADGRPAIAAVNSSPSATTSGSSGMSGWTGRRWRELHHARPPLLAGYLHVGLAVLSWAMGSQGVRNGGGRARHRGRNWVAVRRPDGRQRSRHRAVDQRVWWRAARDSNPQPPDP